MIFAHSVKEAKTIGWPVMKYFSTDEYTDMAIKLLRNRDFLVQDADQQKLAGDIAHVVEDPTCCKSCEL